MASSASVGRGAGTFLGMPATIYELLRMCQRRTSYILESSRSSNGSRFNGFKVQRVQGLTGSRFGGKGSGPVPGSRAEVARFGRDYNSLFGTLRSAPRRVNA